ncbi:MAG TPA: hypothetical protein DCL15_13790 [Chloroflexi bacterium]|nr:hypothetical protein [Chloroflexota bacterium]HHW86797.1 hypothetical protein [Chloroflexota bacterium]
MMSLDGLPNAYWVLPGKLMAGPYPCAADLDTAQQRVAALLATGVQYIIDLTEPGEYNLRPYWPLLTAQAAAAGRAVTRRQWPIPDMGTPTSAQMRAILDDLNRALQAGQIVYVHCFGGIGRTGTVVGCYLVNQGLGGDDALQAIARLRQTLPNADRLSPETAAQRTMVRTWRA